MTSTNFVTILVKSIVTCKKDVVIDSFEEVILGDSSKHYISVPSTITVKGRYLHNDRPFEISFFAKKKLANQIIKEELVNFFLNEKFAYERLLPSLESASGTTLSRPEFYGASEDYVLLQNLGFAGYRSPDMVAGADLEHTKVVLQRLAQFHASSLKLKLDRPDEFALVSTHFSTSFHHRLMDTFAEHLDGACQPAYDALSSGGLTKVADYIRENGLFTLDALKSFFMARAEDDLLNLFVHGDTKSDNMLFLYDNQSEGKTGPGDSASNPSQSKIADVKFIDFQTVRQCSILTDVILFLGTSVDTALFKSDFEQLLKTYFDDFLAACDQMEIATRPSWDSFLRELNRISSYALIALVWYLPIHSMKVPSDVDWGSSDLEAVKKVLDNADRGLYRKKLLDYTQTLSKYFIKPQ